MTQPIINGGIVMVAPDGDRFVMPVGGQTKTYERKGYRLATEADIAAWKVSPKIDRLPPLKDGDWAGRRCFIIGGGPSLKGFDWRRLDGELTIGINRAIEFMSPTISLSIDRRWYDWTTTGALGEEAKRRYAEFFGHKAMVSFDGYQYPDPVVTYGCPPNANKLSASLKHGLCTGGNSGLAALNLALCLGADPIYLLGFDCNSDSPAQEHYHDGYPEMQRGKVYKKFVAHFNLVADQAKKRARIINVNPNSGLQCFEFGDMPERVVPAKYVSYYTPDYKQHADRLIASLARYGLDYDVSEVPSRGKWVENCAYKPRHILAMREKYPDRPLIWIDADAEMKQEPKIFSQMNGADVAYCKLGDEVVSGTMYFAATPEATALLTAWAEACDARQSEWDQVVFADVLREWSGKPAVLPQEYYRVFDHPGQTTIAPVIQHYQASRDKIREVFVRGYMGFGDNLHQRVYVKHLAAQHETVYVETPCPCLYWDIPGLKFVKPDTALRTQSSHMDRYPKSTWVKRPPWPKVKDRRCEHGAKDIARGVTVAEKFAEESPSVPYDFELPVKEEWIAGARAVLATLDTGGKPICIVKWPTVREEWQCETRNPDPRYMAELIERYRDDYHFVSVADIRDGAEWFVGEPVCDTAFHRGELSFETIIGLVSLADMVITYPSVMMLLGIAVRTKTFTVWGGHLPPETHLHPIMGLDNHAHIAPDPQCGCALMVHDCNKVIDSAEMFRRFERLQKRRTPRNPKTVVIPAGIGDMHWIFLKLQDFKAKNEIDHLTLDVHQDRGHAHSHEFVRMVEFVDDVIDTGYPAWGWQSPPSERPTVRPDWHGADWGIEFNTRLELGERIENILREYRCNWDYPVADPDDAREWARGIKAEVGGTLVLLYASSAGGNKAWAANDWTPANWADLANKIFLQTECKPVLIGATWDEDYTKQIRAADTNGAIRYLVSETDVPKLFALIRQAACVVSFPSGIPIMATHFDTPAVMFWPEKDLTNAPNARFGRGFQWSWVDPRSIASGRYVPMSWGSEEATPDGVFDAIKEWI